MSLPQKVWILNTGGTFSQSRPVPPPPVPPSRRDSEVVAQSPAGKGPGAVFKYPGKGPEAVVQTPGTFEVEVVQTPGKCRETVGKSAREIASFRSPLTINPRTIDGSNVEASSPGPVPPVGPLPLDIYPERLPDITRKVSTILRGYFPHVPHEIVLVDDQMFNSNWNSCKLKPRLLDSSAMTPNHWNVLARIVDYLGKTGAVVIIHGTDSLAYSAAALSFMVKNRGFPIVLTGSQLPFLFAESDATRNLVDSVAVATHTTTTGSMNGVHVCFFGKIMRGVHVVKVSSIDNDAFSVPRFQPVGTVEFTNVKIDPMYVGRLGYNNFRNEKAQSRGHQDYQVVQNYGKYDPSESKPSSYSSTLGTQKACTVPGAALIIKVFPGIDLTFLRSIPVRSPDREDGLRCVLLVGLGSGNGPDTMKEVLKHLLKAHCFIAVASDCLEGRASERYATSIAAMDSRIVAVEDMTTEAAYVKILVILGDTNLMNNRNGEIKFKEKMIQSWVGEHTLEDLP